MTATREILERPILFSGPMVRAILDDQKTETRRVINPQPAIGIPDEFIGWTAWNDSVSTHDRRLESSNEAEVVDEWVCPYGWKGCRLWVRETFYIDDCRHVDGPLPRELGDIDRGSIYYRADGECCEQIPECECASVGSPAWRPSIHMPRWVSRISLEITNIRTERLQAITEEDAIAEGAQCAGVPASLTNRGAFAKLWDQINGPRGFGWKANPWVWVVEFKRVTDQS